MNRRDLLGAAAGLGLALPLAGEPKKPTILELRWLHMRNSPDNEFSKTAQFLREAAAPAFRKAGVTVAGAFRTAIGMGSPSLLLVTEYPSLAALEAAGEQVWSNPDFVKAYAGYASPASRVYEREEISLLRSFAGMPAAAPPAPREDGRSHIFELRMYESTNGMTLARKIKMFNDGEIGIFQRLGMQPVFFGQTIIGGHMPNLVYMLCFDDLAARERLWGKFGSDPEWKRISAPPEVSDAQVVSNINNWILEPLDFSLIR